MRGARRNGLGALLPDLAGRNPEAAGDGLRGRGPRAGRVGSHIIRRHILPNMAHLIIITFALTFTSLVLSETILSYLGIGLDGSWGQMIDQAVTNSRARR